MAATVSTFSFWVLTRQRHPGEEGQRYKENFCRADICVTSPQLITPVPSVDLPLAKKNPNNGNRCLPEPVTACQFGGPRSFSIGLMKCSFAVCFFQNLNIRTIFEKLQSKVECEANASFSSVSHETLQIRSVDTAFQNYECQSVDWHIQLWRHTTPLCLSLFPAEFLKVAKWVLWCSAFCRPLRPEILLEICL